MNYFYSKLMERNFDKRKWPIIDKSSLIPILRGNNIVIEKFTISSSWFGDDKYRMYIKIGAKATLPDDVKMPRGRSYDENLGNIKLSFANPGLKTFGDPQQNQNQNKNNGGGFGRMAWAPEIALKHKTRGERLGKTIEYDKDTRTLVLEFKSINDAIDCLNYLPFGFGYRIYLLDSK